MVQRMVDIGTLPDHEWRPPGVGSFYCALWIIATKIVELSVPLLPGYQGGPQRPFSWRDARSRSRSISVTVGIRGVPPRSGWSRAAVATARHWTRHIGPASEREKLYSSSGTVKRTRACLASGESWLSVIATIGAPLAAARSAIATTSLA